MARANWPLLGAPEAVDVLVVANLPTSKRPPCACQREPTTFEPVGSKTPLKRYKFVAPVVAMQAVIPVMRKQGAGTIINVSSGTTFSALPGSGGYASSKAGLNMLSDVARVDLADAGIVVSTMYPFVTDTEFIDSIRAGHEDASRLESSHAPQPQSPEQVAEAILDLIKSGAERADLVPVEFGGTLQA